MESLETKTPPLPVLGSTTPIEVSNPENKKVEELRREGPHFPLKTKGGKSNRETVPYSGMPTYGTTFEEDENKAQEAILNDVPSRNP